MNVIVTRRRVDDRAFIAEVMGREVAWLTTQHTLDDVVLRADMLEIPRAPLPAYKPPTVTGPNWVDGQDISLSIADEFANRWGKEIDTAFIVHWPDAIGLVFVAVKEPGADDVVD